jgi:hypothetical protein
MSAWVIDHQDLFIFLIILVSATLGALLGHSLRRDQIKFLINDYEGLLDMAYVDKTNLMAALATAQARQKSEPIIFDPTCVCEFCQIVKLSQ